TFRANPREVEADEDAPPLDAEQGHGDNELYIRHDNVFGSAEEDALRRDFTINGLFYDLDNDKVIDYVEGLPDLERRTVRTIGDPDVRFREDPIRILRALKFAARLNFEIEPATYAAVLAHKGEIAKCAPPRVLEEIYRLMRGGAARRSLELLQATGVLTVLVPELHRMLAREGDHVGAERLIQTLDSIDALVRGGYNPSNALLVCALIAPFVFDQLFDVEGDAAQSRDAVAIIEQLAEPIVMSMRVSRRDAERARQILVAERRLGPSKKRRGRPMALVRRDWFGDALQLFELMHPNAEGEVADEIARWHRLMREGGDHPPTGGRGAPIAAGGGGGGGSDDPAGGEPRKRRRRRRGGKRRRKGEGSTMDASDSADG
ncbi:MAG: polynucleotide adenylyltransferase PcnB, partial [Polyangia bacterium]